MCAFPSRSLLLASMACSVAGATAVPAAAHDAPMPAGARHGLLPDEPWVMAHWAPFDERALTTGLRLRPAQSMEPPPGRLLVRRGPRRGRAVGRDDDRRRTGPRHLGPADPEVAGRPSRVAAARTAALLVHAARPIAVDPAAPYDRGYTKHAASHTSRDVPPTRAEQAVEERAISRGLSGRPKACWDLPQQFRGDTGAPLSRRRLRVLGGVPSGFKGAVNDRMHHRGHDM